MQLQTSSISRPTQGLYLLFFIIILQSLFAPAASQIHTFNQSCPSIRSSFNITNYTIDIYSKDTFFGSDVVQDKDAVIALNVEFNGNVTQDNFTRVDARLFFTFWCFNETEEVLKIEPMATLSNISSTYLSNDIRTKIKWENSVRVPYNAKYCFAMANAYGADRTWIEKSGCGTNGIKGTTCLCFIDGLTGRLDNNVARIPVWTIQDFFNKKQLEFNEHQQEFSERQINLMKEQIDSARNTAILNTVVGAIFATLVAVVGVLFSAIIHRWFEKKKEGDEIRRKQLELKVKKIYGPLHSIFHSATL